MRLATLYDIHGNLPALEAVLADIEQHQPDGLVLGGDVLSGPLPLETLDALLALELPLYWLMGNGDADLVSYVKTGSSNGLSPQADANAAWLATKLNTQQQDFVATWQDSLTLPVNGLGEVLFCHAIPTSNTFVFTVNTPEIKLEPIFADLAVNTIVCGHTHMQFDRVIAGKRVVNSGSIGMSFVKPGAHWLLLDGDVQFMRTEYDVSAAAARIRASDYPNAEAFVTGNVLSVPPTEAAFEMLTSIEARQAK
ncbi:MAG: metallophosphoesterase family protein [Deinococcota bacterium]